MSILNRYLLRYSINYIRQCVSKDYILIHFEKICYTSFALFKLSVVFTNPSAANPTSIYEFSTFMPIVISISLCYFVLATTYLAFAYFIVNCTIQVYI